MSIDFEELDFQHTPLGDLSLRRRLDPLLNDREVYEIKLGDEFLMSSLFTKGETALAELSLAELPETELDVVVGGLGLGYTAEATLRFPSVRSVLVIEALSEVVEWHRRGLVPLGPRLTADNRCRLVEGDFFALALSPGGGFDVRAPGRRFHAVLLDIDHSPRHVLHPRHRALYEVEGLKQLGSCLHPGGVFAVWSNDSPDRDFTQALDTAFAASRVHVVEFHNPYTHGASACTVYVARTEVRPIPSDHSG